MPGIQRQICHNGSPAGAKLRREGKRIRLEAFHAIRSENRIAVLLPDGTAGQKNLPDASLPAMHRIRTVLPTGRFRKERHLFGMGSPDTEKHARFFPKCAGMCAEFPIRIIPGTILQKGFISAGKGVICYACFHRVNTISVTAPAVCVSASLRRIRRGFSLT